METFKKNQKVIATLPNGREVEGVYIEPYGSDGHSFYVNEFSGIGKQDHLRNNIMLGLNARKTLRLE